MRQLKDHEKKLLRKVNLYSWKGADENIRVAKILRRYLIQNREDYVSYTRLCGLVQQLSRKLKALKPDDPFRIAMSEQLLQKLNNLGLTNSTSSLQKADDLPASAFCRRRLPVLLCRLKMAQTMKIAVSLVEQGQIRVGVNVVTDPSYLVSKNMEDYVTWVDGSKIKRTISKYNDTLDDFDLL